MNGLPPTTHGAACLRAALNYASLGWQIVRVNGIRPDGSCTCGDRHDGGRERTRGKHPIARAWQEEATTDEEEIGSWWDDHPLSNLGVLLGPASGIWDLEYDDAEGELTVGRLCSGLITPTYRSGRSVHRLLQFSPHLPAVTKLVVRGAEGRFGAARAAMSVLPPSRHWSGGRYEWLPGLSPDECDVAETPDSVIMLFTQLEDSGGGSVPPGQQIPGGGLVLPNGATRARQALVLETISEGGRNDTLHAFACREAYRSPNISTPHEQGDLLEKIIAINAIKCRPPLGDDEVRRIVESAITYAMRQPQSGTSVALRGEPIRGAEARVAAPVTAPVAEPDVAPWEDGESYEQAGDAFERSVLPPALTTPSAPVARPATLSAHGLEYAGGSWRPGDWRMTIICGDPPTYRLHVPAWRELTGDQTGDVLLTHDEFLDAGRMARKVLLRTKSVLLETQPRAWASIWCGAKDQVGIRSILLSQADEIPAPPSENALLQVAEILLSGLEAAGEADEPDEAGYPTKVLTANGEPEWWLRWSEFWRRPIEQGRCSKAEGQELSRKLDLGAHTWRVRVCAHGTRRRYLVIDAKHLARLRRLVE